MSADSNNPYVGLRPFEFDESLLFFGRNDQILELLQRLHAHHFVAVVGSSGSGKSSLLRAGLIPALKAGYLVDDSDHWIIPIMKPGHNPIFNLAESILKQISPNFNQASVEEFIIQINEEGADALINKVTPVWQTQKTNFFLLVDQFEELFRFAMDQKDSAKKDEAIDFVNIILELAKQKTVPFYVVITMRSDFIGDCAQFYGLPEAMNLSQYLVPKLNRVQLKTVIEAPARLYGGKLNPTLTSRLLNDLGKVKDELPLLQHVLMRIWDYEVNIDKNGELAIEDYEKIGGISKALSNHADEAMEGMSESELSLTKTIFQALTTIDENGRKIRRPKLLSDLVVLTGVNKEAILKIINRFNEDKRSFLVLNKTGNEDDIIIDISHESLMRVWERLEGWVIDEAESVNIYIRICQSALLKEKGMAGLWRDPDLQIAVDWKNKTNPTKIWANQYNTSFDLAMQFIEDSINEKKAIKDEKRRRLVLTRVAVIIFLVSLISLSLWALRESKKAKRQAERANKQTIIANENLEKAQTAIDSANAAKLSAEKSANAAEKAEAEAVRLQKIADEKAEAAHIAETSAKNALTAAKKAAIEAEKAKKIADREKRTSDSLATIARNEKSEALKQKGEAFKFRILSIAQALAIKSTQAKKGTYSDNAIKPLLALQAYKFNKNYGGAEYDPDIFTALFLASRFVQPISPCINYTNTNVVRSVAYSPDGKTIASASSDGNLFLYNPEDIKSITKKFARQQKTVLEKIAFNQVGNKIAAATDLKNILIYDVNNHTKAPNSINSIHSQKITGLHWYTDNIITACADGYIRYIAVSNSKIINQIKLSSKPNCLDLNIAKNIIAIGCDNGDIYTIDLGTFKETKIFSLSQSKITSISFNDEGSKLACGNSKGIITLFTLGSKTIQNREITAAHTSTVIALRFYPNSDFIASAGHDGKIKIWNLKTEDEDEPPAIFSEHSGWVWDIDINKNGTQLVSGGKDRKVRTYELIQETLVKTIENNTNRNFTGKEWERFVAKKGVIYEKTIEEKK